MKRALIFSTKVWLTGSILAILVSGFVTYSMYHKTFDTFGVSYQFLIGQFINLWTPILVGSIILLAVLVWYVQSINNRNWNSSKKRVNTLIIAEILVAFILVIPRLLRTHDYLVPGLLLWLIYSITIALSVILYKPRIESNIYEKSKNL